MFFEYEDGVLKDAVVSTFNKEKDLEKLLISEHYQLNSSIFGEELLILGNQVRTKDNKRADIIAMDRLGNIVIVELKKDGAQMGVDTQVLSYISDYSNLSGYDLVTRFKSADPEIENKIQGFLGNRFDLDSINATQRVILIAARFDRALFSMGEWLSSKGVPFRCIRYNLAKVEGRKFIGFSLVFDRSLNALQDLTFAKVSRAPLSFLHNIGTKNVERWSLLMDKGIITAGYEGELGDQGTRLLQKYVPGDRIFAYVSGYGAVGMGIVDGSYSYVNPGAKDDYFNGDHPHRLPVKWQFVTLDWGWSIRPHVIREIGLYHPIGTSVEIAAEKGDLLLEKMKSNQNWKAK